MSKTGNMILCKADIVGLNYTMMDSLFFTVLFKNNSLIYSVLMLGNSLNKTLIAAGEDIYMDCVVNANPVWILNVS